MNGTNGIVEHTIITYDTLDARTELKLLQAQLTSEKDQQTSKDLQKFLLTKEDNSWILDDKVHGLIKSILCHGSQESKLRILRILAICALKENFINLLNLDRKEKVIMNYATQFHDIPLNLQKALATLICNLFSHPQTAYYALYFSGWTPTLHKEQCCNAQIVVQLAAQCLCSKNPSLIQIGSSIMLNISYKHVKVLEKPNEDDVIDFDQANLDYETMSQKDFSEKKGSFVALKAYDDMVVEICSSLWEFLTSTKEIDNEVLNRALKTLVNFVHMLDFADSDMADELRALSGKDISPNNQQLIQDLLSKFSVAAP